MTLKLLLILLLLLCPTGVKVVTLYQSLKQYVLSLTFQYCNVTNISNSYENWDKIVKLHFLFQDCLIFIIISTLCSHAYGHMEVLIYYFVWVMVGRYRSRLLTFVYSAPGHHLKAMEVWHRGCSASGCQLWHKPTLLNGSGCVICT